MSSVIYVVIKAVVLPPGLQAALGLIGLALYSRWRRVGLALVFVSVVSTGMLGMPQVAAWLAAPLEDAPPFELAQLAGRKVDAIMVLGGGAYQSAPESHGADEVAPLTLERLRYAARLHRLTGLPLAVTGGVNGDLRTPEADLMSTSLETDFGVPVRWRERVSTNTGENAQFSAQNFGFKTVVLVTHAVHMPRARRAFEDAGVEVIPAPMGFISHKGDGGPPTWYDFVPNSKTFNYSQYAIYERFGAIWYRYFYRLALSA